MCPTQGQTIYELIEQVQIDVIKKAEEYNKIYVRYTTASLNIRKEPNTNSKIVGYLRYNQKVKVKKYNKNAEKKLDLEIKETYEYGDDAKLKKAKWPKEVVEAGPKLK